MAMTQLLDYIVKTDKELSELRSYRKPQPMQVVVSDNVKIEHRCPRCGNEYVTYFPIGYIYKFCPECGQALDWESVHKAINDTREVEE